MLESAVANSAEKLWLQKEIAEAGRVDTDVTALLIDTTAGGEVALLSVGGRGGRLRGLDLLVGVVDEIFLVRHGCGVYRLGC